ncbi:MAG: thiamine diphosphokinase [Bacillota bacterium]
MRCLIFTGGILLDERWHKNQIQAADYLIAADKGAEHLLALGYLPHVVVGDLDSISASTREYLIEQGVEFKVSPGEKDETDTELALRLGLNLKPKEIILYAATGGRLDHLLANIFLLVRYLDWGIPITFRTPTQTLAMTNMSVTIKGFPGQLVSLLAIGSEITDLTLKDFYYPLEKAVLPLGSPRGISNVMLGHEATIEFSKGLLLIIQQINGDGL